MAESPASRQWLDCLTENTEAVGGSEGLLQSGMMSFQAPQQAEVEMNGQSLSDKPQKELTDMSLIATPNFSMFSSDSDGSEVGDVHLPNLSLGEATLEDGLAKTESGNVESNPDPYQSVEETAKLVEQIKLEHPYAEDADGKNNVTYYCPHKGCEQTCSTEQEMQGHVKDKHSNIQTSDVEDDVELVLLPSEAPATTTSSSVIAYKCTQSNCNVICPTIEELAKHIESHDSGQLHRCTIHNCTETFNTLADLREHVYSHRDKRIFTCRICEQSFQFSYQLRKHMELHGEDDEDEQDLEAAMKSMSPKGQSGLSGQSDSADTDPENIQVSGDGKSHRYVCPQEDCGETFSSKHLLTKHSASHDNLLNYKCPTCGKAFMFSFLLKRHRKIHNGLVCSKDDCHKSFANARELKEHMKTHDQVKKRPRGRPRKNQSENTEPANPGSKTEKLSPAKLKKQSTSTANVHGHNKPRPVGRPRKIQPQAAIESPTEKSEKSPDKPDSAVKPKRPRGRPRLNKSAEAVKKPSTPEDVSVKAATTPVRVSYAPLSPGSITPTRCSARSTKGQWRSSGSKTNMGGVGLLTVIKQERTKSRRLSITDVKTDTEDDGSGKEQEKTPRKRQLSEEEAADETPKVKSPKKTQFATKDGSGEDNTSGEEVGSSEKVEKQTAISNIGSTEPPETPTKHQTLDTPMMPKKVIRITSAKRLIGTAPRPRGRPPKSVLKIGHATQEIKKSPSVNVPKKKEPDEEPKETRDAEKMSTSSQSDTGMKIENSPADITNNQAMNSKKLQRIKTSTVKTMSTRQSRGLTCVIPFCTSYQLNKAHNQSSVHFIKFPEQQEDISKWIKILKLPKDFEVKPTTRICHLHFNKSDLEINSEGMWQCREGAAPRIFNAK